MESELVGLKMTQKRRAHHRENMPNKVAKTETEIVEKTSYSDFDHLIKVHISKQTDKIEKQLEKALQMKDYKYADLKHERDTFELQSKSYLSKYSILETENNNMKLKLKKHEEDRANYTKKIEKLVEAYKINVNNQNDAVRLLQCEIDSLKTDEKFLKSSLESMELEVKNTNKQLVEKDDSIKYLEDDLLTNIQEIAKMQEVSLQQMEDAAYYKKVNEELQNRVASLEIESKTMLSKECDLDQLLKEKHESKECIKILQSDLGIKNQEISNLKSLKTANEEELSSLEQNRRETQEELKERKVELERYETVQKRIKADLEGKKQEIFTLQYLNIKNEDKIRSLEKNQSETEEDMKERKIELERCASSQKQMKADLVDKNQEILYLKSLNTTNKETINSLTKTQSETKEGIKERKIELERFTTLQKQMEADLVEKSQEIFHLNSLNKTNEEKISFMEQKQSETEEELKERKIELEKCVTSQKQLKAQEIFQRILAEKLENDLKICESFYGANINHAKKDANEKFQMELENKKSEIKKHKYTICELETQFREKVTEYHILSKTCAELEKQHGADVTLVKVLENLNVKYCKKIKILKKEVQHLGGNSSILEKETITSGNSEKSSDNPERERKEKVEDTFKHVENDATTEEEVDDDHKLHTKPPTKESIKKKEKLAEKIEIISSRDLMDTNDVGKFDLRRRLTRHRENKSEPYYFFKRTETHKAGF